MHYDVVIIGAGMSGLAAGIRLAYYDYSVCIVEKHYAYGGLNSYYTLDGREFDVGLHALTNYAPASRRHAPLNKLLRQLRLSRDDLDLCAQRYSEIRFPDVSLRFSNEPQVLIDQVAGAFAGEADGFRRLWADVEAYHDTDLSVTYQSTRAKLAEYIRDPLLIEMLLCPIMFYGNAEPRDMDFTQFVTMFKSIFCEGFARPRDGVRTIIKALVRQFRRCGGKLRMSCGVERIEARGDRAAAIVVESGETFTADTVLSSAGYPETMALCGVEGDAQIGELTFVESIAVLDSPAPLAEHKPAIVFFNDTSKFEYAPPSGLVDLRSGVVCCPNNYDGHDGMAEGILRFTWLANHERWAELDEAGYRAAKEQLLGEVVAQGERFAAGFGDRLVFTDMFTPRTIERFTGHFHGAVYGSPRKIRGGRTHLKNLFICGTDQGFLGIIGAMLSGITIANLHVLSEA